MQLLSGLAMLVFVVTCAVVGLRLLWLASARDGGWPAWTCGLGFTLIAVLGYPLPVLAGVGSGPVGEVHVPLAALGYFASSAGVGAFFVFTAQVFRSGVLWARALAGACLFALAVATTGFCLELALAPRSADSFLATWSWGIGLHLLSLGCFAWIGVEGLLQWSQARRRVALGLSDPVVAGRFLMWGLFGLSTTLMVTCLFAMHLAKVASSSSLAGQLAMAGFGLLSSAVVTMAFFPPRAWRERLRAGA